MSLPLPMAGQALVIVTVLPPACGPSDGKIVELCTIAKVAV